MATQERPTQAFITEALKTQSFTLREMGAALGVSHQAVAQWADGTMEPTEERLRSWLVDPRPWVKQLGFNLFMARHGDTLADISSALNAPKEA